MRSQINAEARKINLEIILATLFGTLGGIALALHLIDFLNQYVGILFIIISLIFINVAIILCTKNHSQDSVYLYNRFDKIRTHS